MADVTMLEAADYSEDTKSRVFAKQIVEESPILEYCPIHTIKGVAYRYPREEGLGTVGYRGVGGSYTANAGVIRNEVETLAIAGGEVFLDNYEIQAAGGVEGIPAIKPHKYQMKARAMGLFTSQEFFEGSKAVDRDGMDGLIRRISGNQLINAGTGGATLALSMLDELIDAVAGGPDALFMNKTLRRKVSALVRAQTGTARIDYSYEGRDAFNRQMQAYAGVPIRVIERQDDASTFLEFNEDDGSANLDTASIYAVKFGMEYVHMIANGAIPSVKDFGEIQARPGHLGRVEWFPGIAIQHPRAAARLNHINNA
jgi:hypothetical protein